MLGVAEYTPHEMGHEGLVDTVAEKARRDGLALVFEIGHGLQVAIFNEPGGAAFVGPR